MQTGIRQKRDRRPGLGRRAGRGRAGGFTLAEIMIAMGILAVGMGMIAAALHAGISVHVRTMDDIMRQLIADNALAIVQAQVRHSNYNGITKDYKLVNTTHFGPTDLRYPTQESKTPYGAAVFMKKRVIDEAAGTYANDYEVLVIPYTLVGSTGSVGIANETCSVNSGSSTSSTAASRTSTAGSPASSDEGSAAGSGRSSRVVTPRLPRGRIGRQGGRP